MTSPDKFHTHTIRQRRADGSLKSRELHIPSEETRDKHRVMLGLLYNLDIPMPYATGGLPGKNVLEHNVRPHQQSNSFYALDITDAYHSVEVGKLLDVVDAVAPEVSREQIKDFINEWGTAEDTPGLPMGAPCSPYLFNLYCSQMDTAIGQAAEERDLVYTRYLDDITVSSVAPLGGSTRRLVRDAILDTGMEINHGKTKHHTLGPHAVTITGVSIYPDRRLQPSPALMDTARKTFEEIASIQAAGGMLFDSDIGRLHGWHGVLRQLGATETPTTRALTRLYDRICERL